MNKIDFDSLFDNEKQKKKEAKKQRKASNKIKPLNSTTNIDNETSETKDITDIGYESSGIKNKLDLSNFNGKQEYICSYDNCKEKFKSDNALKKHINDVHKNITTFIKNNNLESKKNTIRLFFKKIDPNIKINYDSLDLYSVHKTLDKMKDTIEVFDKELKEKIIINILTINEVTIKNYLPNYSSFLQNRTATICLSVQEYLKIISVARYEKYFKSMKWSICLKYTINDYPLYHIYRKLFFDKSKKGWIICEFCERLLKEKNLQKHLMKKCPKLSSKIIENKTSSVNKFKCRYCDAFFSSYEDLDRHEKKHSIQEKDNFIDKEKLNAKENLSGFSCLYCDKKLKSLEGVDTHVSIKHQDRWKEYIQDEVVKLRVANKKSYRCKDCGFFVKDIDEHLTKCFKNKNLKEKDLSKEEFWEKASSIKEIEEEKTTLSNIEKHQAIKYQFREDEELDPDLIDEEAYQKTFGTQLDDKSQQIRARVAFEHEKIYKQEEEDKSEIKIFLTKMYKGYCQVCGYTFKKTNGVNSFERFNWNDKRVVKVKKSLVSTADSLCLCRNCSANIKWGAFYPNFVDTIREIEEFKSKNYDEIREILHKVVDENIPKIFERYLEFDDVYALEIELDGKPRNIYFTNEHLLQFITYLQKEDEVEAEVEVKKKRQREKDAINSIYSANSWLKREETIPLDLAESFIRATANWDHPTAHRYVSAPKHADNIYKNIQHGWAVDFGSNSFLVGKAIERCKSSINEYIENQQDRNLTELKEILSKHISGAVATGNNYEYSGYYPIEDGYMKFGVQGIDVEDGVSFLIRRLGLENNLISK